MTAITRNGSQNKYPQLSLNSRQSFHCPDYAAVILASQINNVQLTLLPLDPDLSAWGAHSEEGGVIMFHILETLCFLVKVFYLWTQRSLIPQTKNCIDEIPNSPNGVKKMMKTSISDSTFWFPRSCILVTGNKAAAAFPFPHHIPYPYHITFKFSHLHIIYSSK